MSQAARTETIMELLVRERVLVGDRKRTFEAHEQILGKLNVPLKKRFSLYWEKFQPLLEQANALGRTLAEVHAEVFSDSDMEWGNSWILTLRLQGDFLQIVVRDLFCGEYVEFIAYIPAKYLEEDGEQRLLEDAQRLEAELKAAHITLEEADRQKKEDPEFAEFVRLQAKFSGRPSS